MKSKYYLIMLLIFIKCHSALSQGLDASPAGVMISHGHPKGGWMLSYTYMNMMMKDNYSGTSKVSDETVFVNYLMSPQKMRMDMHMIMAMYGLTGHLSFMAMANYNYLSMDMNMLPGTMHMHGGTMEMSPSSTSMNTKTSGLGDVKLWALYKLLNGEGSSLVLSAGISFPTGKIDIDGGDNVMYQGQRLPYMMQLGTGSYDLMPGITYLKRNKNITWSVQALSVLRPFYNSNGYHYGNEFTLNGWIAYQIHPSISASLRLEGCTSGAIHGSDDQIYAGMEPDANPINYGGTKTSAYIGANLYINKGFMCDSKFGFEFGIPFYQYLNGIQLATQYILNAGITKSF